MFQSIEQKKSLTVNISMKKLTVLIPVLFSHSNNWSFTKLYIKKKSKKKSQGVEEGKDVSRTAET